MTDYAQFRQRLDAVLRTVDVEQVRQFMITEEQWDEDVPTDPTFAMWMMIAGSPTLQPLHAQAREWLMQHGHEDVAETVLGKGNEKRQPGKKKNAPQRSHSSNGGKVGLRSSSSAEQRFRSGSQNASRHPKSK
jgi:hypothetical protein